MTIDIFQESKAKWSNGRMYSDGATIYEDNELLMTAISLLSMFVAAIPWQVQNKAMIKPIL